MLTNVYKVINNLLGQNISTFTIIKIFMLYIPASFQLTIPMSIMIAILMSLGRLAADSEIIVLRACGVSIKQISKPVWIFAILMTIFNFYSINYLSPMSLYKARKTIQKILENTDTLTLSEKKTININTKKITIEKIDNNHLTNIKIIDEFKNIITAQSGIIEYSENEIILKLTDGYLDKPVSDNFEKYDRNKFGELVLTIELPETNKNKELPKKDDELSYFELAKKIKSKNNNAPETLVDLYLKLTIPFACIALTFVGLPIGLTARRTGKAIGFTWGILSIFVYYLITSGVNAIAYNLNNPKALINHLLQYIFTKSDILFLIKYILWLPNIIMCIFGMLIYFKFVKNKL